MTQPSVFDFRSIKVSWSVSADGPDTSMVTESVEGMEKSFTFGPVPNDELEAFLAERRSVMGEMGKKFQEKHLRRETSRQAGSYALVGVVNTAIDFCVFAGALTLGALPLLANAIAWTTAFIFSYMANSQTTFRTTPTPKNLLGFFLASLLTLFVSSVCIFLLTPLLGVWPAKIGAVGISYLLGFALARVVFKSRP